MSSQTKNLVTLADTLAAHENVTHWAISMRITKKGDLFANFKKGGDCRSRTADRVLQWFDENWPEDLEWPSDIPRPSKQKAA